MKTISSFLTPTAGKITIDGTDLAALKRKDRVRLVSYVLQAFGSNANLLDVAYSGVCGHPLRVCAEQWFIGVN